jgi:hypothetical protein
MTHPLAHYGEKVTSFGGGGVTNHGTRTKRTWRNQEQFSHFSHSLSLKLDIVSCRFMIASLVNDTVLFLRSRKKQCLLVKEQIPAHSREMAFDGCFQLFSSQAEQLSSPLAHLSTS